MMKVIGAVCAFGMLALTLAACASPRSLAAYVPPPANETAAERMARYEAWRRANPDIEARLRRVVAETRALIAANTANASDIDAAPVIFRTRDTGLSLWDCAMCPEMVVTPAGNYTIGSPESEPDRFRDEGRRRVNLAYAMAVSRFEITRDQYEAFVIATNHPVRAGCFSNRDTHGTWAMDSVSTFRDPSYAQTGNHPVACVNWEDAQAYVAWLNTQTDGGYRFLTESEWEFLARAGSTTAYPWGDDVSAGCGDMNGADATALAEYPDWRAATCSDGALNTSPVGAYRANPFGLYDMIGNLADWVQDCYVPSYDGLPGDGAAVDATPCAARIVRGGSWGSQVQNLRVADRYRYPPTHQDDSVGIRVARTLGL